MNTMMKTNVKKLNVKGLVMALVAPFVLGQCNDSQEEMVQTDTPDVFEAVVAKTAPKQASVEFDLKTAHSNAEWKVYAAATGTSRAAGITVECYNNAVLVLMHATDIRPSTYYVSATEPGKSESGRLPLTVSEQAQTATPETSIASVAKSAKEQASVTFTLDNKYSSASICLLYSQAVGASGQMFDVVASLKGETLTLMHATDVPERIYFLAVTDKGKTESERLQLMVTKYVPGRTPAPQPVNTSVAKKTPTQLSVEFPMQNTYHSNVEWKVYDTATEGAPASVIVTASYSGNTLTLSRTSGDVPEVAYFVTATEPDKTESAPVKLQVNKYTAPQTTLPEVAVDSIAKTTLIQTSVVFTLTNAYAYSSTLVCKVYASSSAPTPAIGTYATINDVNLTLSREPDILGDYYVSITEGDKTESERLKLTVTKYEQNTTLLPTVASAGVIKTANNQQRVNFTLTNPTIYKNTTWTLYAAATGPTLVNLVSASNTDDILTLEHGTDVPERIYYVTAKEGDKMESAPRLALTVARDRTSKPDINPAVVAKTAFTQASVEFILINGDPAELPVGNTEWRLYGTVTGTTPLTGVRASHQRSNGRTLLTLTDEDEVNISVRDYWLTATVPGKLESERVHLTVREFSPDQTPAPIAYDATRAKTDNKQATISFPIANAVAFSSLATWKVYLSQKDTVAIPSVTARLQYSDLILAYTGGDDIPTGDYWVAVTEYGGVKKESERLKLTVEAQAQTATPKVTVSSLAKTAPSAASMKFTIENSDTYSSVAAWQVYTSATSLTTDTDVKADLTGASLILKSDSNNVAERSYWVTATEDGKKESERLMLKITAYEPDMTPTPTTNSPSVAKTKPEQNEVVFTLTNNPGYTSNAIFKVYAVVNGTSAYPDITPSFDAVNQKLTLKHATDVEVKDYYITAQELHKKESAKLKLTVTKYVPGTTPTPSFAKDSVDKTADTQLSVQFTLTNANEYDKDTNTTKWEVYSAATGTSKASGVTATKVDNILTLSHATDVAAKNYWITASNLPIDGESERKQLTVKNPIPAETPTITTHPASRNYAYSATATALTVAASVSDGGTLSYQWFSNVNNNNSGGTAISSATNASYTPTTTTADTFYYYVVVTNTNNAATGVKTATKASSIATIKVEEPFDAATPTISVLPANTPYVKGNAATPLTITASVTDGGTLSYQWFSNVNNNNSDGTAISSATNASYTPPTATSGIYYYYVVVTNTNNAATGAKTKTATSNTAKITVAEPVDAATPNISALPAPVEYVQGTAATPLTVTVSGNNGGTLSYQWYKNTSDSKTGASEVGTDSASYTPPTATIGTVYYYVEVTNTNNDATGEKTVKATSNIAKITVTPSPDLTIKFGKRSSATPPPDHRNSEQYLYRPAQSDSGRRDLSNRPWGLYRPACIDH
ncbi:hypothetical protein AGMMS4957_11410 [Bacteroidia bacterium]|nr:hypothetical protein AGMMS4957_11410 [Bacteroidia bacterium]